MMSLLFLICTNTACVSVAHNNLYRTEQECQLAAEATIAVNQLKIERGEVEPHSVAYKCISWGETA